MKNFKKSSKLDHVCYDIRGPVMDEANRLIAQGCEILKLNIGNPAPFSLMAPEFIPEQMTSSLYASEGYSDSKGILPAREAIAAYCAKKGIVGVTSDDVYTGNGVSELITMVMQGLLDSGDEVLLPAVGDRVAVRRAPGHDMGVIECVLPRRTSFERWRGRARGERQVLCSNVVV